MANDFFFLEERRNLRSNHLARRYMMWFNSKKREHSYTKRMRNAVKRLLISTQNVTGYGRSHMLQVLYIYCDNKQIICDL